VSKWVGHRLDAWAPTRGRPRRQSSGGNSP
jgi:hypothetical protein